MAFWSERIVVTFFATQGGGVEGYPTSDPSHALGKDTDTESETDADHIIGLNWKHARIKALTPLQVICVGQISDLITQALERLPVIVG